ncbi:ral guanine nucleotide dissociation [Lynx pardinus]|uniref:Ral guanine nucleotide dissociation n=1 Tax=Lynx pardinus TaxID=191816 RepID=A0A485MJV8_LYNPA|nr:ral guanine nucleotide dissociation [Lynx pardinus]
MAREARPAAPRVRKGWVFFACVSVVTARRWAVARRATLRSPAPWPAPVPAPATENWLKESGRKPAGVAIRV